MDLNMKKVLFIIPYYGELPPYFDFWLQSCKKNPKFEWLLVSDKESIRKELPNNVHYHRVSFAELQNKIETTLGIEMAHFTPYRLCDCKPFLGEIFKEKLINYDFWGWSDVDLIFGDLAKFVTPDVLGDYDKIYNKGHLSLVKNSRQMSDKITSMLDLQAVKNVFLSEYPQGFDENMFNELCSISGVKSYEKKEWLDINPRFHKFVDVNSKRRVSVQNLDGKIIDDKGIEHAYVHFQKRSFKSVNLIKGNFFISHEGFTLREPKHHSFKLFIYDSVMYFRFLCKYLIPQSLNRLKEKLR